MIRRRTLRDRLASEARTWAVAAILLLVTLTIANVALAQTCASHGAVMERLAEGYGEARQSIGIGANNAVVEVWANTVSGTWTITVTRPGGPTCLVASGFAFEVLAETVLEGEEG